MNLNIFRIVLLSILFGALNTSSIAQDENWWKQLFKKETVEDIDQENIDLPEPISSDSLDHTILIEDTTSHVMIQRRSPGIINVQIDPRIDSLDMALRENPELDGYRIQIFFGNLQEARKQRAEFLSTNETPCYLKQNAPNFSVRIGDYRTKLEAHKALNDLKDIYPGAYIVKDLIEIPELPEIK